ncbi:hypothetical protein [Leptospira limi]|uniref:Lipoprotein n=1 Tax=Leptospira limi TaxID=2950023 RepID=A0ABT3LV65_9LEPT|nr:hypothetical protein [Leptospira limi]MCW7461594.1 hypothetical protein [Leptospira limi]
MKLKVLFLILNLCISCSVFYSGERRKIELNNKVFNRTLSYELIGWDEELDRSRVTFILSALEKSGKFSSIRYYDQTKADLHLQIILESSPKFKFFLGESTEPVSYLAERKQDRFLLYLVNRFLAVSTFFVVPDIDRDDDYLLFRLKKKGKIEREYRYSLESYRVFGWVSILFMWVDDSDQWNSILTEKVSDFLGDINNDL